MISAAIVIRIQDKLTELWHQNKNGLLTSLPAGLVQNKNGLLTSLPAGLVQHQHSLNYQLWHHEDNVRDPEASDTTVARCKRLIDELNQRRNNTIEMLDNWIATDLADKKIEFEPRAKLNTETVGSVIDRLSIISLRRYHVLELLDSVVGPSWEHLVILEKYTTIVLLRSELARSLQELLDDIYSGRKRHHAYQALKLYNDPMFNHVLKRKTEP